jgi:hypothetical protein
MEASFKDALSKTGIDTEKVMDGNDHWYDAKEALAAGLVHKIIDADATISLEEEAQFRGSLFKKQFDYLKTNHAAQFNPTAIDNNANNQNQNKPIMKNLIPILLTLGMTALSMDSSESQVADAIRATIKAKDEEIQQLKDAIQANLVESKKAVLDNAKAAGRINDEQHKNLSEIAEKLDSVDDVNKLVNSTASVIPISAQLKDPQASGKKYVTWDDYQADAQGQAALERLEKEDKKEFDRLYNEKFPD